MKKPKKHKHIRFPVDHLPTQEAVEQILIDDLREEVDNQILEQFWKWFKECGKNTP